MSNAIDLIEDIYVKLNAGDLTGATGLMSHDIEWITMRDHKVEGNGRRRVAAVLPLMTEWTQTKIHPSEFIVQGECVVALGHFGYRHKNDSATIAFAHVWRVADGQITQFRQYADTLAITKVRGLIIDRQEIEEAPGVHFERYLTA